MNRDDAEECTQALGQIVAGSWRQIALAQKLDVPAALDMTLDQWVSERLGGDIKLMIDERREAVKELVAEGHNNVAVGDILGVDERTVRRDLSAKAEPREHLLMKAMGKIAPTGQMPMTTTRRSSNATSVRPISAWSIGRGGPCPKPPQTNLSSHACAPLFLQTVLPLLQNVLPNVRPCRYLCN
jgi:hypothetical protein